MTWVRGLDQITEEEAKEAMYKADDLALWVVERQFRDPEKLNDEAKNAILSGDNSRIALAAAKLYRHVYKRHLRLRVSVAAGIIPDDEHFRE